MRSITTVLLACGSLFGLIRATCPYADPAALYKRDDTQQSENLLDKNKVDDSTGYMTSDVGGPIGDQVSLKAGLRGSTLLEDFIFRQKIQHFDHERVGHCRVPDMQVAFLLTWVLSLRFPKGPSMLGVPELMAPSPVTLIGVT